jgi:hypothetical protein
MYDEVARHAGSRSRCQAGITVLLGADARRHARGRRIRELELATRYGDALTATGFVDATAMRRSPGRRARVPRGGRRADLRHPDGVIEGRAQQPTRPEVAERLGRKAKDYGLTRESGFAFVFPGRNVALVNMTHVETLLDPVEATARSLEGKVQPTARCLPARRIPGGIRQARVRTYGGLGIRQTRWIAGRQQLTVEDVRAGRAFPTRSRAPAGRSSCTTRRRGVGAVRRRPPAHRAVRQPGRPSATIWSRPGAASTATSRRSPACA